MSMRRKIVISTLLTAVFAVLLLGMSGGQAFAASVPAATPVPTASPGNVGTDAPLPSVNFNVGLTDNPQQVSSTVQLLFLVTIISLAPSILIMMTSFTRIIISLYFLRSALGTQQMPPNTVLVGLALFLTLFIMGGIFTDINDNALKPYSAGQITQEQALTAGMAPLRTFMLQQCQNKDIALFSRLAGQTYATPDDIPNTVLIPAFMLGELTRGFEFGFIIYLPFIAIDMVVASVLMAMGMMMLPPAMISLPFKILLFVMVDGWSLVMQSIVGSFRMAGGG